MVTVWPQQSKDIGASATEAKLRDALSKKEKLILALRDAVKQLGAFLRDIHCTVLGHRLTMCGCRTEAKLIQSEKQRADSTIQNSSEKESDKLANLINGLRKEKASLETALVAERGIGSQLKNQLADTIQEKVEIKDTVRICCAASKRVLDSQDPCFMPRSLAVDEGK